MMAPEEVRMGAPGEVGMAASEEVEMGVPEEDAMQAPEEASPLGHTARSLLVAASLGAGAIHIWAAVQHAHPKLIAQLVFFIAVATFQFWWGAAVLWIRRIPSSVLIAGAVVNAAVVAVWVFSRTTGLPWITRPTPNMDDIIDSAAVGGGSPLAPLRGYVGHPESFGLIDTACSALEIVVIVGVVLLVVRMRRRSSEVLPDDSPSPVDAE